MKVTIRNTFRRFVALAAVFVVCEVLGENPRKDEGGVIPPGPPGETVEVKPTCGGTRMIGPFHKPANSSQTPQVLIHVKKACGDEQEAEIEVEKPDQDQWEPVRERVVSPTLGPQTKKPRVDSWYVVAVPDDRRIRLGCMKGQGECAFEVKDITSGVGQSVPITGGKNAPACGKNGTSRLINLSGRIVKVTVTFTSLCKAGGYTQKGLVHFVLAKPLPAGASPPATPTPLPVNPPAPATWTGNLDTDHTLEASCTGGIPSCKFEVSLNY